MFTLNLKPSVSEAINNPHRVERHFWGLNFPSANVLHKLWAYGVSKCPPAMFLASKRLPSLVAKAGEQSKLKSNEISMRSEIGGLVKFRFSELNCLFICEQFGLLH